MLPMPAAMPHICGIVSCCCSACEGDADLVDPSEATVVKDEETKCEAIELYGRLAEMSIPCRCDLPYLVMQVKDVDRFMSFEVTVVDHEKRIRKLVASNKQSMARVKAYECSMPLTLKKGWNYVCLDLPDLTQRAFGTQYQRTKNVTLRANCRVLRVYFQDRRYEDVELPAFLRVIK